MLSEKQLWEARKTKSIKYFAMERAGSVLVVVLGQSLDSLGGSELLAERTLLLEEIRDPAIEAVVFDFANVEYFGSLVLDTLCQVWKHLRERGGKMALCSLSEAGDKVLRTSRLDALWHPHSSRLSALTALGSAGQRQVMSGIASLRR
jgi:anti-anti-sigma factor